MNILVNKVDNTLYFITDHNLGIDSGQYCLFDDNGRIELMFSDSDSLTAYSFPTITAIPDGLVVSGYPVCYKFKFDPDKLKFTKFK